MNNPYQDEAQREAYERGYCDAQNREDSVPDVVRAWPSDDTFMRGYEWLDVDEDRFRWLSTEDGTGWHIYLLDGQMWVYDPQAAGRGAALPWARDGLNPEYRG